MCVRTSNEVTKMLDEIPNECIVVVVCGKDVRLDPEYMKFNEANINKFMEQEYGWIDYFGKQLELAQKELALASLEYDVLYNEKYIQVKDQGNSDTYSKAKAQTDTVVIDSYKKMLSKRETVGLIKAYLRAWDRNHDNAQNRGHTLRKEFEKLKDTRSADFPDVSYNQDKQIEDILNG